MTVWEVKDKAKIHSKFKRSYTLQTKGRALATKKLRMIKAIQGESRHGSAAADLAGLQ